MIKYVVVDAKEDEDLAIEWWELAGLFNIGYTKSITFNFLDGTCTLEYVNKAVKTISPAWSGQILAHIQAGVKLGVCGRSGPAVRYKY